MEKSTNNDLEEGHYQEGDTVRCTSEYQSFGSVTIGTNNEPCISIKHNTGE